MCVGPKKKNYVFLLSFLFLFRKARKVQERHRNSSKVLAFQKLWKPLVGLEAVNVSGRLVFQKKGRGKL